MKPRKNYRSRPKKSGAKRRQRILSQKKRLIAAGYDEKSIKRMTVVEIRDNLKKAAKKKKEKKKVVRKPKSGSKTIPKKTVSKKTAPKKKVSPKTKISSETKK